MEHAPHIDEKELLNIMLKPLPKEMKALVEQANSEYCYWTEAKYKKCPPPYTSKDLWKAIVAERKRLRQDLWDKYNIHFALTSNIQKLCHELDVKLNILPNSNNSLKDQFLNSSLMEEAISSSQMEGAITTRKVAKDMLQKKITPKDKSQQMIHNNYQTIRYIVDNKEHDLTEEMLFNIHRLITEKTLANESDAGQLRTNDNVVVENGITHEIVHTPPLHNDLPEFVSSLCLFFNDKEEATFIHPIIKAITIHFMVAYMHPFVDGNGRTARALFYWYMLKYGYRIAEYLSISRIIYRSKASYEKAFLYSEADSNDIGYFVNYHLRVIDKAIAELLAYVKRRAEERQEALASFQLDGVNERQAIVLKMFRDNPQLVITVKDIQVKFSITPTTAKKDLMGLVERNILKEISLNKVKKAYIPCQLSE